MAVMQLETETRPFSVSEQDGLRISKESVSIDRIAYKHLQAQFPRDFDTAMYAHLAHALTKGIITPHAVVVKEKIDETGTHYDLLHKPAMILAYRQCNISDIDVVVVHDDTDAFSFENATNDQLLYLAEQGALIDHLLQNVTVHSILSEGSIVDEEHRDKLADQLAFGQEVPIWVRARPGLKGSLVYDIVDGYHRTDALRNIGARMIEARVSFGMTDEELYDQRVMAAVRSAKSVKFARTVTLMQQSFAQSKWFSEYRLKLSQVMALATNAKITKQPGKNLGISEETGQQVIQWVLNKAELWGGNLGSIYQQVRAAEDSFPEIIQQVRNLSGGGHTGDGALNTLKFISMVEQLPGKFHLQRIMVNIIRQHNLNSDQTRVVASALSCIEDQQDAIDLVVLNPFDTEVLSSILKQAVTVEKGKFILQDGPKPSSDPADDEEEVLASDLDQMAPIEDVVAEAQSETIFQRPNDVYTPEDAELPESYKDTNLLSGSRPVSVIGIGKDYGHHHDYEKMRSSEDYEKEITELQAALEIVNAQLARGRKAKTAWYETLATLTPQERDVMRKIAKLHEKGFDLIQINSYLTKKFHLTHNQLSQLKRSAFSKWNLFLIDTVQAEYDHVMG